MKPGMKVMLINEPENYSGMLETNINNQLWRKIMKCPLWFIYLQKIKKSLRLG